jgi:hypothetical protein
MNVEATENVRLEARMVMLVCARMVGQDLNVTKRFQAVVMADG